MSPGGLDEALVDGDGADGGAELLAVGVGELGPAVPADRGDPCLSHRGEQRARVAEPGVAERLVERRRDCSGRGLDVVSLAAVEGRARVCRSAGGGQSVAAVGPRRDRRSVRRAGRTAVVRAAAREREGEGCDERGGKAGRGGQENSTSASGATVAGSGTSIFGGAVWV